MLSFAEDKVYALEESADLSREDILNGLRHVIYDTSVISSCFDGKADYADIVTSDQDKTLSAEELIANLYDCKIAAYLLNPLKSDYEIVDIANEYLGLTLADWSKAIIVACMASIAFMSIQYFTKLFHGSILFLFILKLFFESAFNQIDGGSG